MALQYILANSTGIGIRVDLGTLDDAFIAQGVTVGSTDSNSIVGTGDNHAVTVAGSVIGPESQIAISLGASFTDSGQRLSVTATGLVSGDNTGAVLLGSGTFVDNRGEIFGGSLGLHLQGDGATSRVLNSGSITSTGFAVFVQGSTGVLLTNTGLISGAHSFISAGSGADTITNRGTMRGDILLGGGADRYDGRGGTVEGNILGGEGNDTFLPGTGLEVIDGGTGVDTLDFRSTAGVRVYLENNRPNTGTAAGDDYTGIETVLGSATGNDVLVGDSGNNILRGLGGVDTLLGGSGIDNLGGGAGIDQLTGGLGNDGFVFQALSECGDVITDFRNLAGDNDAFRINAAGFGGGLVIGALAAAQFQTRADNLAQDGDDRFIFRTTDQTLWFDANGNVAGGLTLVADLQAGAVVTAADILIF